MRSIQTSYGEAPVRQVLGNDDGNGTRPWGCDEQAVTSVLLV